MDKANHNFGGRLRPKQEEPTNWQDLVDLSNEGIAFIYQRLSTHEQIKRSIYSVKAQDALEDLAKEDGYTDDSIYVERRDLGISGTKGREERMGLAHMIELVEAGRVEAVYVVHISRLYRDQTLINALALGELFKKHEVIVVTPMMRYNLANKMHMRLYRMEIERAADELEIMAHRLLGAQELKAKSGLYVGEKLPPGYIVDERKKLPNGEPNPNYHTYQIYEPHAQVVRIIFEQLAMPGMTPTKVTRYCKRQGIVFAPFSSDVDTPANCKTFKHSKRNSDGRWPVTVYRLRNIATNPAYIGWKVWAGEVIGKNVYPPIIDEATFWIVQDKFKSSEARPKKEYDPLPLGGLLYCGDHDVPQRMTYTNKRPAHFSFYACYDVLSNPCTVITSRFLDKPIGEAVIDCLPVGDLAERTLNRWADEYEAAKEQAASYRREMKRLETEIENLRSNLTTGVLSAEQLQWLDKQIQERLARISELADLENQPIGATIGHSVPGKTTLETVRAFLENLSDKWEEMPNGLKNAVLHLLLDKVIIWCSPTTVRVKLIWQLGGERELLIHRPPVARGESWTEEEYKILRKHYETASIEELLKLLPGRSWPAIKSQGYAFGLTREHLGRAKRSKRRLYTPEEDELIRQYYAGDIHLDTITSLTGRTANGIGHRARKLGLKWQRRQATWSWVDDENTFLQEERSPRP